MVDPTSLIVGGIAVAWLLYIVPRMLADREQSVEEEIQLPFSANMRVVHGVDDDDRIDEDLEVSTPYTRRFQMRRLNQLAARNARRRRNVLTMFVMTVIAISAASALGYTPWWVAGMSLMGLGGWIMASRVYTISERAVMDAVAQDIRYGSDEPTVAIGIEDSVRLVELSQPIEYTGSLWDPVPVTAPTYVQKPLAPRTVRTIDLSAPMPDQTMIPPTADRRPPVSVEAAQTVMAEDEVTQEVILPKAVGE